MNLRNCVKSRKWPQTPEGETRSQMTSSGFKFWKWLPSGATGDRGSPPSRAVCNARPLSEYQFFVSDGFVALHRHDPSHLSLSWSVTSISVHLFIFMLKWRREWSDVERWCVQGASARDRHLRRSPRHAWQPNACSAIRRDAPTPRPRDLQPHGGSFNVKEHKPELLET